MKALRFIGRLIRGLCFGIGVAFVALLVVGLAVWLIAPGKDKVEDGTVLLLALSGGLAETPNTSPFANLLRRGRPTMRDVLDALEKARGDDRVAGIVADLGGTRLSLAQVQELRDAVTRLRDGGKFAHAYADVYTTRGYYLATAFDQIWLQPTGDFYVTGLGIEVPFARALLDEVGVTPRFARFEEYKGAFDSFLETEMTAPFRESMQSLLDSLTEQVVAGIAERRGLAPAAVHAVFEQTPLTGVQAAEAGLVDHAGYWSDLARQFDDPPQLVLTDYLKRAGRPHDEGRGIAVIYGSGQIVRGRRSRDPFDENRMLSGQEMMRALAAAAEDDDIEAIILRVDSGGGSYTASDAIWHAIREIDKPVIVSMAGAAASGGYFIAAPADKIVAQPATLTGSIGVIGGKFVAADLWARLGVTWGQITTSANAGQFSPNRDFTSAQWDAFQARMSATYEDFVAKVAEGRGMAIATARSHAKGRVWTGAQAKERGLVDALGGFDMALRLAREAAGIGPDDEIELVTFPERAPFELFDDLLDDGWLIGRLLGDLSALAEAWTELRASLGPAATLPDDTLQAIAPALEIR